MKRPLVFSIIRDQSLFMTAIMSLLSFLAVLSFGVAIAIGTGVARWNTQWDLYATVQIMDSTKFDTVKKAIDDTRPKLSSVTEISQNQMKELLSPWLSGGGNVLENYLPRMYEIRFKEKSDIETFEKRIGENARVLTHATALKGATGAGWRLIFISSFIMILILTSIVACVSYIARNTAILHRRELEILAQIGATDGFVARQMQWIVAKICAVAVLIGFVCAAPVLLLIEGAAHGARVGLMAMLGLGMYGWISLGILAIAILVFAIWITKKTTLKILENN